MLVVIESHPVQYHAPVFRALQMQLGVPVTAIYGSDLSIAGYQDKEFGQQLAWDTDLLSGYSQVFLSRVGSNNIGTYDKISAAGTGKTLYSLCPSAILLLGYNSKFNQRGFFEACRLGVPMLFRGETTDHAKQRTPMKAIMRDVALRMFYQRMARLLYIGQHSYAHYDRLQCPKEKLVFSPYCVDASSFQVDEAARAELRSPSRQQLGIGDHEFAILFSGKLSTRKGPDLIIQAIKQLPERVRDNTVILFLGNGHLANDLQQLALESPQVKIRLLGFQNQTKLSHYYQAADLMILPSRESETWGLVVNEALHHGLPCIISAAVGCAPDLIDEKMTGFTFFTNSIESLASTIIKGIDLIGRAEVRSSCRQKVSSYSVIEAAKGIANAYFDVTASTSKRSLYSKASLG